MTDLLVIAPHPDDEILGCGATMARYVREGKTVSVSYVGDGCYPGLGGQEVRRKALGALGFNVHELRSGNSPYLDQRFELYSRAELAESIGADLDGLRPATVLIPFYGDVNLDHRVVFEAAMVALRPTREFIRKVACYETASSTEWGWADGFRPDWYVEVTNGDMNRKAAALDVYGDQMKPHPHPRGVEAATWKAKTRGREVCAYYAEAFMTMREVDRV